jgi:hypothetical protein
VRRPESSISQKVGDRIVITAESLPKPFETKAVANGPRTAPASAGAALAVPAGFEVKVFAEGDFQNPRWMIEGPNGDLFLADSRANTIILLRDHEPVMAGSTTPPSASPSRAGLNQPFGTGDQPGLVLRRQHQQRRPLQI